MQHPLDRRAGDPRLIERSADAGDLRDESAVTDGVLAVAIRPCNGSSTMTIGERAAGIDPDRRTTQAQLRQTPYRFVCCDPPLSDW